MPEAVQQMGASDFFQHREVWIGVAFLIVFPIAMMNSLEKLKFTSTMSVFFIGFVSLMIISFAFSNSGLDPCGDVPTSDTCVGKRLTWNSNSFEVLQVMSIFVFAFTCHQVSFLFNFILYFLNLLKK